MAMSDADMADLREAVQRLESISLPIRIANYLGRPVELGIRSLPDDVTLAVHKASDKALRKALDVAIWSMGRSGVTADRSLLHKSAATVSGAAGGMFGWPALVIELPISTMIMLRAIADIARAEHEDLAEVETRLQCLSVFALGSPSARDDAAESGYFASRAALAKALSAATEHIARKGLAGKGAPVLITLINRIATRFSATVSQKVMAQALPVIGAVGGASVNLIFIHHFQEVARGHFVVRRLERTHGQDIVRAAYQQFRAEMKASGEAGA